jgi:hypothetical protein
MCGRKLATKIKNLGNLCIAKHTWGFPPLQSIPVQNWTNLAKRPLSYEKKEQKFAFFWLSKNLYKNLEVHLP